MTDEVKQEDKSCDRPKSFQKLSEQVLDFTKVDDLMLVHGRYEELSEKQKYELLLMEDEYVQQETMPNDPMDPYYYHVYSYTLPIEEYYRIVPEGKLTNDFEIEHFKNLNRKLTEKR